MTVHNCPKHGLQYRDHLDTDASCPRCRNEREKLMATQALKDLMREYGGHSTPTDPAAALIAAAEAWVDHFTGEGWADPERWMVQPAQDLVAAIRAYRQSRQPQGVKPSVSMVGRSEGRRVGKECVSTGRVRWSHY